DELFNTKVSAREELRKAEKRFRVVLDGGKVLDEGKEFDKCRIDSIRERATFGLAQTSETAGDLEKAMESWSSPALKESGQKPDRGYRGVLNLWPTGTYAAMAQKRLEDLQRPSTRIFYDDFAKWEPRPPLADEPGVPGVGPSTDLTVPDDRPVFTPTDPTKPDAGGAKPSGFPQPDLTPDEKPAPVPKEKPAPEPATKATAAPVPKEKPVKPAP
ncbi:MAG TPA: hypothetical protein VM389_03635, partial [Phycisphaerae bacterium]|nr:hypothetical protein [Phycisphaerae bacterium]